MKSRTAACCVIVAALTVTQPIAGFAACDARSGPATAALVELYTSEGCSSCPPADRQLGELRATLGPAANVVPLALHVGYWDYIGWRDPYAQDAFSERQRWLVERNHSRTVYTPHFFVGGIELPLQKSALSKEVAHVNARTAEAEIHVSGSLSPGGTLALSTDATARTRSGQASLYVAVTESGLVSKVARGENSGATLTHDYVVREWIGPLRLAGGVAHAQREITLPAAWNRAHLDLVAFVQDDGTGRVLQAVSAQACARS
jgi:hypothetical protein